MKRQIIEINQEKCNGCGACANACHESAIVMINGKATLLKDDYCDGLGDCLPACPTNAISFVQREAAAYDEAAVIKRKEELSLVAAAPIQSGCPGSRAKVLKTAETSDCSSSIAAQHDSMPQTTTLNQKNESQLMQWPVQIKLLPTSAPYYDNAKLLIAADCSAYAYASFHEDFIKGHITLIGCPKLDNIDYSEKLTEIIRNNNIKSVTVVRMEVPCCGGLEYAAKKALQDSGKFIPWQVVTLSSDGKILDK